MFDIVVSMFRAMVSNPLAHILNTET